MKRYTRIFLAFYFALSTYTFASSQCPITVSAGEDKYLCVPPTPTQLDGEINGDYLNFFWTPTTGMTGAGTLHPTVNVSTTTTYVLTARAVNSGLNLINNGDFESGNSGFTSGYAHSPGNLWPEGVYEVLPDPSASHPNFAACPDHTSGSGSMMAVNGAGVSNVEVWCQSISISPNTQYVFSAWLTSLVGTSPALLQFSINGSPLGGIFSATPATCNWQEFYAIWNSGSNTTATICINNQNTAVSGNDFALDDISFAPICVVTDTVTVYTLPVTAVASPTLSTIPCEGATISLNGTGSSTGPDVTYEWQTVNGNIVSGGNTLMPVVDQPGSYTLVVTREVNGTICTKTATVNVVQAPNPLSAWINNPSPLGCGSNTVLLIGNSSQPGFSTYSWVASNGGNIVSSPNQKNITVNAPGTYSLTVTNSTNGCSATAEVTVVAATNIPVAQNQGGTITCTQPTVTLTSNGSTTGSGITYSWTTPNGTFTGPVNGPSAIAGSSGMYILAVTNTTNNCTSYDTTFVLANNTYPAVSIVPPGVLNCNTDTLTISSVSSPLGLNFNWIPSGGGQIISGQGTSSIVLNRAGQYILRATNPSNGCTSADTIIIAIDTVYPTVVIQMPSLLTCAQPSLSLNANGTSAGANFSYHWTAAPGGNIVTGSDSLAPVINAPGTYTLQVLNTGNGCSASGAVTVLADPSVLVAVANAPDTLTCTRQTVALNTTGSTVVPGLIYQWTSADGNPISGGDTPNPTVTFPGTYSMVITNPANGCTASDIAVVIQNIAPPIIQILQPDTLTCIQPTLSLQALVSPTGFQYTFGWTTPNGGNIISGDTTSSPTVDAPGQYMLTVTRNQNGCTATATTSVALETGTPVAIIALPATVTCKNPVITLDASGSSIGFPYIFSWQTSNGGHFASSPVNLSPLADAAGEYHLTITNQLNGCTASASVTVLIDTIAPPAIPGPGSILTCTLPQASVSVNTGLAGPWNFFWQTTDGQILGSLNLANAVGNQGGIYQVIVSDTLNGCTNTAEVALTTDQLPPIPVINEPDTLNCLLTSLALDASASGNGLQFSWGTADGNILSGSGTPNPIVNAAGNYSVTITNPTNGCSNIAAATVKENINPPVLGITPPGILTCGAPQMILQAQNTGVPGQYDYFWSTQGGMIITGASTLLPEIAAPGIYSLSSVNPENGCWDSLSILVSGDFTPPFAEAGFSDTLDCLTNSLILQGQANASGPISISWTSNATGSIVSGANTINPVISSAGIYTLSVTNQQNGCTASDTLEIFTDANAPNVDIAPAPILTCTDTLVTLSASASGANGLAFSWIGPISSGQGTLQPIIAIPGNYSIIATNPANGCTALASVTVGQDIEAPLIEATPGLPLTCDSTQRTISALADAGGAPVSFLWSTTDGSIIAGHQSPYVIVGAAGLYTVTIQNLSNGCTASDTVLQILDTLQPVISISPPEILTCAKPQAALNGTVSQPISGFNWQWQTLDGHFWGPIDQLIAIVDQPGTYRLTVRNSQNGCTAISETIVTQDTAAPVVSIFPADTLDCLTASILLDGTASATGSNFSYLWTGPGVVGGANTALATATLPGQYFLTVANQINGCTAFQQVVVARDIAPPVISILPPGTLTCSRNTVPVNASASSSGPNFTYAWGTSAGNIISGQNTTLINVNQPGFYSLTITNSQNGCSSTVGVTVNQNIASPQVNAGENDLLHCNRTEIQLSATAAPGLSVGWSTTTGHILGGNTTLKPTVDAPGDYFITVTNPQNGCTASDSVSVSQLPLPTFSIAIDQPDCLLPTGTIEINQVTDGQPPYVFSANGGNSFSSVSTFSKLNPGMYGLVVEDAYGCQADSAVAISIPIYPEVSLPEVMIIELGDSSWLEPILNMSPLNIIKWQWSPGTGLQCDTCMATWAMPTANTVYRLQITDKYGCTDQADMRIWVNRKRNIYAPNIIMPSSNQFNNLFNLYGKGVANTNWIRIYDRWGNQVFEINNPPINSQIVGWDGRFNGQEVNPGVFIWMAEIIFLDGETQILSGDVTVIR